MGSLRTQPLKPEDQFYVVDDEKLRMTLIAVSDRFSENVRKFILKTYSDPYLYGIYDSIRISGRFQKGSKGKTVRKVVEFPHPHIYDFVGTVLGQLYGPNWLNNPKALRHELVRPWLVVEKL